MSFSNCETILVLTWSSNCITEKSTGAATFGIRNTKLYAPTVTLSTQDNWKLLRQNQDLTKQLPGINMNKMYQQIREINI